MVMYEKPDWKCVFTYVQTFFRRFRNGRDPPTPTKKLTLTPPTAPNIHFATKSIEVSTTTKPSSTTEPYYFPAPEITEEKKMSLAEKYLMLDNDQPKKSASSSKKVIPSAAVAPKPKKVVKFTSPQPPKEFIFWPKIKAKSFQNLHIDHLIKTSELSRSHSLPTVSSNGPSQN